MKLTPQKLERWGYRMEKLQLQPFSIPPDR